jgi:hypothetical protein
MFAGTATDVEHSANQLPGFPEELEGSLRPTYVPGGWGGGVDGVEVVGRTGSTTVRRRCGRTGHDDVPSTMGTKLTLTNLTA